MKERPIIGIAGFGSEGRAVYEHFKGKATIHIFDDTKLDAEGLDAFVHFGLMVPSNVDIVYKTFDIPMHKLVLESSHTQVTTSVGLVPKQMNGVTDTESESAT